jgi:hypothetical protein
VRGACLRNETDRAVTYAAYWDRPDLRAEGFTVRPGAWRIHHIRVTSAGDTVPDLIVSGERRAGGERFRYRLETTLHGASAATREDFRKALDCADFQTYAIRTKAGGIDIFRD